MSPAAAAPGTVTYLSEWSSGGIPVTSTDGHAGFITPAQPNTLYYVQGDATDTKVGLGEQFEFKPPAGGTLAVGTYSGALDAKSPGYNGTQPSLSASNCNGATGAFTISDIGFADDGSTNRLRVSYTYACPGFSPVLSFVGELVVNETPSDPNLVVAPGSVQWPDTVIKTEGATVPINLYNDSAVPETITSAKLSSLAGINNFTEVYDGCSGVVIHPGEVCTVWVSYNPLGPGSNTASLDITDDTPAESHSVPLAATAVDAVGSWSMHSEPRENLGQGKDYAFSGDSSQVSVLGAPQGDQVQVRSQGSTFLANFNVGNHDHFAAGRTYTAANGSQILMFGPGSCGGGDNPGVFSVQQADYNHRTGYLMALRLTFEFHCFEGSPGLYGSIAWNTASPPDPIPGANTSPPSAPVDARAGGIVDGAEVAWDSVADSDFSRSVVRAAVGDVPPATLTSGWAVYSGTANDILMDQLDPGVEYSFSIWNYDIAGNVSARATTKIWGTDLPYTAAHGTVLYGVSDTLTTQTRRGDGKPATGFLVNYFIRPHGTYSYSYWYTDETQAGTWVMNHVFAPAHNVDVVGRFPGALGLMGNTTTTLTIYVAYRVTAATAHPTQSSAAYDKISGVIYPHDSGARVYIQRYYSGAWHTGGYVLTGKTGGYAVAFKPIKGTFAYRMYRPASKLNVAGYSGKIIITGT
ncbi:MAG: hypothetical protein QOD07_120 [Frankiaceae bacterium]|nr:hypothetical protein [Frankiaceae bacterium]